MVIKGDTRSLDHGGLFYVGELEVFANALVVF